METIRIAGNKPGQGLRIFLVEDHPDTLTYFCFYLQSLGHTVTAARTLHEALKLWPLARHDLLLADLHLPDGDGWELPGRLVPRPLFAVAVSGLGAAADRAKSHAAGFRHHLLKPFKLAELVAILQEAEREAAGAGPAAGGQAA